MIMVHMDDYAAFRPYAPSFFQRMEAAHLAVLYDISDINGLKLMFFMIADKNPTFN